MMILKAGVVLSVIVMSGVAQTAINRNLGIDLSHIPTHKRIIHSAFARLCGAAIGATVWFI